MIDPGITTSIKYYTLFLIRAKNVHWLFEE
jgi:hypothetical protein